MSVAVVRPIDASAQDNSYTIYFDNTDGWEEVWTWVWDNNNNYTGGPDAKWPGVEISLSKDYPKLYSYTFTSTNNNNDNNNKLKCIFNNGKDSGNIQTQDMELKNGHVYSIANNGTDLGPASEYTGGSGGSGSSSVGSIGAFVRAENANGTVTITGDKGGKLMITPYSPDVVKIFTLPQTLANANDDSARERRSISVVATPNASYSTTDTDREFLVNVSDGVTISVDKSTCYVSFLYDNNVILAENGGLINNSGNRTVTFAAMHDKGFYGAGYNGKTTNIGGTSWKMHNTQTGGWNATWSAPHNICIPYYLSTNGYGVLFDDHYIDAEMTPSADGSTYRSQSANPIAYYFVGGGSMEKAMQNYQFLTGYQPLPPFWALGYITSRYGYHSANEAKNVISRIKDESKLPLDGIVFDLYWQGSSPAGMGNLEWYTQNFPNPTQMLADFKAKNVNTICITEPFFTSDASTNYDYLKNNGYLADEKVGDMSWLTNNSVGLIDTSNENAMTWMGEFYKRHTRNGVAGWWLDLGEPERHFFNNCHHAGGTCQQIHNEFGALWIESVYNALTQEVPNMRHLLLPRSGTAGMQRFSTFPWTGDIQRSWEGLQAQVPALVNCSMSGVGYLGSDIGGFCDSNNNSDDLYLRWVQLGVFYPVMRTHAIESLNPEPYNRPNILDKVRDAINLRYAYIPYTYTRAYLNTRYGSPMARPANFADEDKSVLANCKDAYLWGPDIFVAPVVNSSTSRDITFPDGDWLDMKDFSTIYQGHQTVNNYDAPLEVLPRFMRRGAFVPRYRQDTFSSTAEICTRQVTIDYFPSWNDIHDSGMIYDDDRNSADNIDKGNYLITNFEAWGTNGSNGTLTVLISREGNGWTGDADGACQDLLFQIHDFGFGEGSIHSAASHESSLNAAPSKSFKHCSSLEEVKNENSVESYAIVDNNLYVRIPQLNTDADYMFIINSEGLFTGVDNVNVASTLSLTYASGYLTYSATDNFNDLDISIFNPSGTCVADFNDLTADGYANQVAVSLPNGLYIARLTGIDHTGCKITKTIKMLVK
ncbi:MAG: glycoside hydrolase family 31 protein [Bacteroidales bacterium]|nr:glycoside hydrolase family 31 protein [Bacteroidales bacterium]